MAPILGDGMLRGMRSAALLLSPYQAIWPEWAAAQADALLALFAADAGARVEHIGSTAVPGLCAKPVIDLMLGLPDLGLIESRIAALAGQGWRYRPAYETELPERRYFVREADAELPRFHLHGLVTDGRLWRRQVGFRDALRERPRWTQRYDALKQQLARRHAGDKAAYQAAKSPFILACLSELGLD